MERNKINSISFLKITFSIFLLFMLGIFFLAKDVQATCYCVDPVGDNCGCTTPASDTGAQYPSSFNGIPVVCDLAEEANSLFSIKDPVCGNANNNEIVPYCAAVAGQTHQVTCWGTGFTLDGPDAVPYSTGGIVQDGFNPNTTITFNSFNQSGFTQIFTCWENNFCCSRTDVSCEQTSPPFTGSCSPEGPVDPQHAAACEAGPVGPGGSGGGDGESRLWFSQTRLISALASIAQTMQNPQGLNSRYNTTAFSKNAPRSDTSGEITNSGALTTRVEQHQGIDDPTPVVNTTDNNSSVIEGTFAPFPLYGFGNTADENPYNDSSACYIPETVNNPGDDLMGPRIEGELLLTQQFNYDVPPMPDGCVEDGEAYTRIAEPELEDCPCCSAANPDQGGLGESACQSAGNPCTRRTSLLEPCTEEEPFECTVGLQEHYCCPTNDTECHTETGICASLPPVELQSAPAEAQVFSKTPIIELVYDTIIDGEDSLYRRFMPDYPPIAETVEKPTSSFFNVDVSLTSPQSSGLQVTYGGGQTSTPEIYFPHIGTLAENWLWRFQEALRPQGIGSDEPIPPGPPDPPGPPPADGYCSPAHIMAMEPKFTAQEAQEASCICQAESKGSLLGPPNTNCLLASDGENNDCDASGPNPCATTECTDLDDQTPVCPAPQLDGAQGDYSVGLFQINLQPRATFTPRCDTANFPNAFVDDPSNPWQWCEIDDQQALDSCVEHYTDVASEGQRNIQEAYNLYQSSGSWCPWSTASFCGLCQ